MLIVIFVGPDLKRTSLAVRAQKLKHHIRPSPAVRKFPVDGGLLLLDNLTNRLSAYNDTARHVWDLIEAGVAEDEIAAEFARAWRIPISLAQSEIESIMVQWCTQGLVATDDIRTASNDTFATCSGANRDRTSPPSRGEIEWTCTIGRTTIAFVVEADLVAPIRPMLSHLETFGTKPEAGIEIRTGTSNEFVLFNDGKERIRTRDHAVLVGGLWQTIIERIHPNVEWLALMHGAAVARKGEGLALCGPSGSGKSTLTAALTSVGFGYLADDLIAVSAPCGAIVPCPVPAPTYRTKGMGARLLAATPNDWEAPAVPLRRIIFPRFFEGATAKLQRISTFDAIERLLADRIWIGYPITADRVACVLSWLSNTPAYTAVYDNLNQGVRLIETAE